MHNHGVFWANSRVENAPTCIYNVQYYTYMNIAVCTVYMYITWTFLQIRRHIAFCTYERKFDSRSGYISGWYYIKICYIHAQYLVRTYSFVSFTPVPHTGEFVDSNSYTLAHERSSSNKKSETKWESENKNDKNLLKKKKEEAERWERKKFTSAT